MGRWVCLGVALVLIAVTDRPLAAEQHGVRDMVLAVNWQPAFCERRGWVPECRDMSETDYHSVHFALHGLWPQPRSAIYCGVSDRLQTLDRRGKWDRLPALTFSRALRRDLGRVMPGVRSALQHHQWIKHGTCSGLDPEAYFRLSIRLIEMLNAGAVRHLFANRIDRSVDLDAVRAAFDRAFGMGAGRKVSIGCTKKSGRTLVDSLRINLRGRFSSETRFRALIANAPPRRAGCRKGLVDRAGMLLKK